MLLLRRVTAMPVPLVGVEASDAFPVLDDVFPALLADDGAVTAGATCGKIVCDESRPFFKEYASAVTLD